MNIYVGNLSFNAMESDIERMFGEFGEVKSVSIVKDRDTGRSRGFAFVEMRDSQSGQQAIDALHESSVDGRAITVNEARPRESRSSGGGGGGSREHRGGNGGGNGGGGRGRW